MSAWATVAALKLTPTDEIPVTKPLAFTVICGTKVEEPKVPVVELTVANVPAAVTFEEPSNAGLVYAKSPVIAIVLAFNNLVAVAALPAIVPVIVVA